MGKADVQGGNLDQYRMFYSCLYRSLLFPRMFWEVNAEGQPVHYSPYNGEVLPGYMYTDTGFWDTFRCLFPLLNLMYPSENLMMQEGLINTYKESGFFQNGLARVTAVVWWVTTQQLYWWMLT